MKKAKFWIEHPCKYGSIIVYFKEPKVFRESNKDWGYGDDCWCLDASTALFKKLGIKDPPPGELLEIEVKAGKTYVWG